MGVPYSSMLGLKVASSFCPVLRQAQATSSPPAYRSSFLVCDHDSLSRCTDIVFQGGISICPSV